MSVEFKLPPSGWGLFFGFILAGAFLAPCPAGAGPDPMKFMGNMDDDEDGRISKDEWLRKPKAFKKIDTDKNGYLALDELKAFFRNKESRGRVGATPAHADCAEELEKLEKRMWMVPDNSQLQLGMESLIGKAREHLELGRVKKCKKITKKVDEVLTRHEF